MLNSRDFASMGLSQELLTSIYSYGYENASEIQASAIPGIISGKDIVMQAPSGTGKTGAFAIGVISRIKSRLNKLQGIIISPTRELALQTCAVTVGLSEYLLLRCELAVGGVKQKRSLTTPHILSGTPGRILQLLKSGVYDLEHVQMIVLDEADILLESTELKKIYSIYKTLPTSVQMIVCSATINNSVKQICSELLVNPIWILKKDDELTIDTIDHMYIEVKEEWKVEAIGMIYSRMVFNSMVIFVNTRKRLEWLMKKLQDNNYEVSIIHGKMEQTERNRIISLFRTGVIRVLLATDVIARGLDIHLVSIVVNFELSSDPANYLHRVGRSGRFGRSGLAINLITPNEKNIINKLQDKYKVTFFPLTNKYFTKLS